MLSLLLSFCCSVMKHFCLGSFCHPICQQLNSECLDSVSNFHSTSTVVPLCCLNVCFLFFPPFKPSSFLFWPLPSSPLSFLYFLTLSGLVSCVTGNVTVSAFFSSLIITAPLSFRLYSLHYCFLQLFFPLMIWFTPHVHCTSSVLWQVLPEQWLHSHLNALRQGKQRTPVLWKSFSHF